MKLFQTRHFTVEQLTNPGELGLTEPVNVIEPEPVSENPRHFLRLRVTP